jgi:hypothetical protein
MLIPKFIRLNLKFTQRRKCGTGSDADPNRRTGDNVRQNNDGAKEGK